jgi:Fic family protein
MHPVKSNKKEVLSSKDIFLKKKLSAFKAQKNLKKINKVLKIKTNTATDSITVNS